MDGEVHHTLVRIEKILHRHGQLLEQIMQGEDDLKQAIIDNAAALTTAAKQISDDAAKIAAVAAGDADGDIEALANQLKANTAQFNLAVANAANPPQPVVQNTGGAAAPAPAAQTNTGTQAATGSAAGTAA